MRCTGEAPSACSADPSLGTLALHLAPSEHTLLAEQVAKIDRTLPIPTVARSQKMKRAATEAPGPATSKKPRGCPIIKSLELLQEHYGRVMAHSHRFPVGLHRFFAKDAPQAARIFTSNCIDLTTKKALLQLLSRPVTQATHLASTGTGNRKNPLYVFLYTLLAACRHGDLIISAEGLEGEQDDSDSKDEGEEWGEEEEEGEEEGVCCSLHRPVPLSDVYWR